MIIYFAPLEGVTDVYFRRIHHSCFSGVTKYFIPFISPTQNLSFSSREQRAISPVENAGIPSVPQILTRNADHFLWMANMLSDIGYKEVNLNLGCPSGTVTAKGKGSGMLRNPEELDKFLDEIYAHSPISVSVKTRIGFESPDEWPALLSTFSRYPIHELIVHPRTRKQFYNGMPHRELCASVLQETNLPFVYNGDLFSIEDCRKTLADFPGTVALMIGRGLIANPALAQEINGGEKLTLPALRSFHDQLYAAYTEHWPKNAVIGHMHEFMRHIVCCFEGAQKPAKAIRKANTHEAYCDAVRWLFDDFPLREAPGYLSE